MPTAWFTTGGSTSSMTSSPQSTASAGTQPGAQHVTFIHSSDFQLGMTRWFLSPSAQSRFDDDREEAVVRLGELATETGAEFIVVAGDVFEHNSLTTSTLLRSKEVLKNLPVPVYLLPGNHDPLVADSIFSRTEGIEGVHVLGDSVPVTVREGVELVGAPLLTKHASEDLCAKAIHDLEPTEAVRVLVGHGQAEGFGTEDTDALIDIACLNAAASRGVIDYVALGDTHSTAPLSSSGRVWFSGAPEVTDFHDRRENVEGGEVNSGKALVVGVDKRSAADSEVSVDERTVGEWTFDALHFEVSDSSDVKDLLDQLEAYPEKSRTVVKYSIAGTLGLEATRELEEGLAAKENVFGALYERERLMDLHLEPSDEELTDLPLSGYARDAMSTLLEMASVPTDPEGAASARDAVNLLFRLSKEPN